MADSKPPYADDVDHQRWATFDCYGTLVDWNAGIRAELDRLFGAEPGERLLPRYHAIEPHVQDEHPAWSYRQVMAVVLAELASEAGVMLPDAEGDSLVQSLPTWPVFAEVPDALAEAHRRGWKLFALSNSDRDLIDASLREIGVPFAGSIWSFHAAAHATPNGAVRHPRLRAPDLRENTHGGYVRRLWVNFRRGCGPETRRRVPGAGRRISRA